MGQKLVPEDHVYRIKVSDYYFYVNLMIRMMIMYLAIVGVLLKFAMIEKNSINYYIIVAVGIIFCFWTARFIFVHQKAEETLKGSLDTLAEELGIIDHVADAKRIVQLGKSLALLNLAVLIIFIVMAVRGPPNTEAERTKPGTIQNFSMVTADQSQLG